MTRKAKERRQERVLEKQRARDRRAQREQQLSGRADWRALLRRIDGDDQAAVSPRHRLLPHEQAALEAAAADASAKRAAAAAAAAAPVADTVQWKSTHVPVAAASVFQLPIKVDAPRATLAYAFSTQDLDINFGVQAIGASDGAMHDLVPTARYESQLQRVRGSLVLAGPAMVLLVWDNSFSWLNAKQLAYEVELRQEFPAVERPPPVETAGTPTQRAALALHERAKRERLRAHREASSAALEAAMLSHDKQRALLEHQIEELRRKLEETEALKVKAAQEKEVVEDEIDALAWEIDALLWRSMGSVVIEKIFSFCSERELSAWSLTSHQWHSRIASYRDVTARIAAAGDPTIAA